MEDLADAAASCLSCSAEAGGENRLDRVCSGRLGPGQRSLRHRRGEY